MTTFNEVDMRSVAPCTPLSVALTPPSAVINMRAKHGAAFIEKHKIKLGFMGIFLKACATALMENSHVNALMSGKNLIYSDYADISVAVATNKGLVTPIVRNCESLSIASIEMELAELSSKVHRFPCKLPTY